MLIFLFNETPRRLQNTIQVEDRAWSFNLLHVVHSLKKVATWALPALVNLLAAQHISTPPHLRPPQRPDQRHDQGRKAQGDGSTRSRHGEVRFDVLVDLDHAVEGLTERLGGAS